VFAKRSSQAIPLPSEPSECLFLEVQSFSTSPRSGFEGGGFRTLFSDRLCRFVYWNQVYLLLLRLLAFLYEAFQCFMALCLVARENWPKKNEICDFLCCSFLPLPQKSSLLNHEQLGGTFCEILTLRIYFLFCFLAFSKQPSGVCSLLCQLSCNFLCVCTSHGNGIASLRFKVEIHNLEWGSRTKRKLMEAI
jgi:hypothetical protein